jgi:hypothetical protein
MVSLFCLFFFGPRAVPHLSIPLDKGSGQDHSIGVTQASRFLEKKREGLFTIETIYTALPP